MREYKLPKKTLLLWRIRAAALWLFLAAICAFYSFTMRPFIIALCVLTALFLIVFFWYFPTYFRLCKIKYLKDAVIVESGVIIRVCHIMPYSRLIYTQALTTPIAKLLGLTAITLKAARSSVLVPELETCDAKELITLLTHGDSQ